MCFEIYWFQSYFKSNCSFSRVIWMSCIFILFFLIWFKRATDGSQKCGGLLVLNFTSSFLLELLKDWKTSRFKTSVEMCPLKIKITVSKSTFISLQVKHMGCKMFGIYYTYFLVTVTVITVVDMRYLWLFQNQLIYQTSILKTELALVIILWSKNLGLVVCSVYLTSKSCFYGHLVGSL